MPRVRITRFTCAQPRDIVEHMSKVTYWIQDVAPNGEFGDSIGLDPQTNIVDAVNHLKKWRTNFPERKSRLILRMDVVIAEA